MVITEGKRKSLWIDKVKLKSKKSDFSDKIKTLMCYPYI